MVFLVIRQLARASELIEGNCLNEAKDALESLLPGLRKSSGSASAEQAKALFVELANQFSENDQDLEAANCLESAFELSTSISEQVQLLDSAATSFGFAEEYDSAIKNEEIAVGLLGDGINQSRLFPSIYHRLGRWCRLAGRGRLGDCVKWYRLFLDHAGSGERDRLLEQLAYEDIADSLVELSSVNSYTTVRVDGMGSLAFKNECRYLEAIKLYRCALDLTDDKDVERALRLNSAITDCYFFEETRMTIQLNGVPKHLRNLKTVKPLIELLLEAVRHKEGEIAFKSPTGHPVTDDDLLDLAMLAGEAAFYTSQFGPKLQREMPFPELLALMMSGKQPVNVSEATGYAYCHLGENDSDLLGYTDAALEMADKAMVIWDGLFEKRAPLFTSQYEKGADGYDDQESRWVLDQGAKQKVAVMQSLAERGAIIREGMAPPTHFTGHLRAFDEAYRAVRIGEKTWTDVDIEIYPLLLSESIARGGYDCAEAQEYRNSLGWAWFRHGDYSRALFYFESQFRIEIGEKGIDGFEDEFLLKAMLRTLARLGRYREAIELAVWRINMRGWDRETTSYLAMLLIEVGEKRTSKALVEWLLKKTELAAYWPELLFYLAIQVDPIEAEAIASDILSGNEVLHGLILRGPTKHAMPYLACMGCANYIREQYEEALAYYDAALTLAADECGYGYYDLGGVYLHLLSIAMITGADNVPNVVDYVGHALEFVKEQSALAFEIVDEDLRYGYLETSRHIVSLCNSLVVDNPSLFTNERIATWLAMFSNMCNSATYYQSRFSSIGEREFKRKHRVWLDARQRELTYHSGYLLDSYASEIGDERFEAEGELVRSLSAGQEAFRKLVEEKSMMKVPPNTAVLEFGSFFYTDGYYANGGTVRNTAGMVPRGGFPYADHYYVSVRVGSSSRIVYLHECNPIDEHVKRLRASIASGYDVDADIEFLRTRLIKPVESLIGNVERLCIVPEGGLCILPFEILQHANPTSSFDLAAISYLFSIDQREMGGVELDNSSAAVFSNPSFALSGRAAGVGIETVSKALSREATRESIADGEDGQLAQAPVIRRDTGELLSAEYIASLPWTGVEANLIQDILSSGGVAVEVLEKEAACKAAFVTKRPAVLHVATHGFAFDSAAVDVDAESERWSRYCKICKDEDSENTHPEIDRELFRDDDRIPFQHAKDPMMRCGLLFSGASDFLRGYGMSDNMGDGIVTGSDILTMDYSQVELAVLASCKSALGETRCGEGVQGLRKAFDVAGIGTLVCSLWDVDDFSSSIFMGLFYERLSSDSHDVARSLQLAKNALRVLSYDDLLEYIDRLYELGFDSLALDAESRLRTAQGREPETPPFASPYHWAGYVCIERLRGRLLT